MRSLIRRISSLAVGSFLMLGLFGSVSSLLSADTKIVDGTMTFRFEVRSNKEELLDSFYEYKNNSNSQKVVERGENKIVVETKATLDPFESEIPFPVGDRYRDGEISEHLSMSTSRSGVRVERKGSEVNRTEFVEKTPMSDQENTYLRKTAKQVTEGAETQHEAVERIMRHIRKNVSYQLDTSNNPVDVLRSGKAYCEGYANVAALLLRSIGIPANVMNSYIPPGHMWGFGQEGSGGFHAHVEVYYEESGWVSYDPQATVHYVDPFHIVEYPRRNVRMDQLEENDNRRIIDRLYTPEGWDNFYQRKTEDGLHAPLLVGTVYTRRGRRVEDSFRSDEWVYKRTESGEGKGVRILSNGTFAVSPPRGENSVAFFYRDGNGGWMEETVRFEGNERIRRTYRLDEAERGYTIRLKDGEALYLWYKDDRGRDRVDKVRLGKEGSIFLISEKGRWVVSGSNNVFTPRYLLDAEELKEGKSYAISELPRYYDPNKSYATGIIPNELNGVQIRLLRSDGQMTNPVPLEKGGKFAVPLPNEKFDRILLQGEASLGIKRITEHAEKNTEVEEGDEKVAGKRLVYPDFEDGTERYIVETGRTDVTVFLVKKKGRRFQGYGRTDVDEEGRARIYVDSNIEEERELYVFVRGDRFQSRKALKEANDGVISFEKTE